MYVSTKHQKLLLTPPDPDRILGFIPSAQEVTFDGKRLVAVPHELDEVKVLRNLGVSAPAPILSYYNWPSKPGLTPFTAQRETAAFLTLNNRAYVLSQMGCVDSETEYLTPTGWQRINTYDGGQVAQYHPETGTIDFVQPDAYIKKPCDTMIRIKTKYGLDQLLSPEHRVLIHDGTNTNKREVLSAEELLCRQDAAIAKIKRQRSLTTISFPQAAVPTTFIPPDGAGVDLSEPALRVQIAVIADGYFPSKTSRCIVRLKKDRKKTRLRGLLNVAGISFTEKLPAYAPGYSIFTFNAPLRLKYFDARFWQATHQQLGIIANEVLHWDGSIPKKASHGARFSSYVKDSSDFVQYVFNSLGYTARLCTSIRDRRGKQEVEYHVHIRSTQKPHGLLYLKSSTSDGTILPSITVEPSTDGFKYCFTVPTSFLLFRRNGCVFASGNTGKSLSTLWAADYLMQIGAVKRALILSPLSTLERVWGDEIFTNFYQRTYTVLHADRKKRKLLLEEDTDFYIINHDGIKILADDIIKRKDIGLIIIDELSVFRNAGTDRWKALKRVAANVPRVWGLTGTPIPNEPTDAHAQCMLITPETVPPYFSRFRDATMRQVTQYKWVARHDALDTVKKVMQPSIRFTRDDCFDLPKAMYETRQVSLSAEQAHVYKAMMDKLRVDYDGGQVTAANEGVKLSKLLQIASGIVYTPDGGVMHIPCAPRVELLKEVIREAGTKVIVFATFTETLLMLERELTKHWSVGVVDGSVTKTKRNDVLANFQRSTHPHILLAHPRTTSHGLTLTEAGTIIWYTPTTSSEQYEQANDRIQRSGQKNQPYIVHIESSPVERKLYDRLRQRQKTQGVLLDMMKGVVE